MPRERDIELLANLILEQFGREDWREDLIGIDRREAERLSRHWLRQLWPDAPTPDQTQTVERAE